MKYKDKFNLIYLIFIKNKNIINFDIIILYLYYLIILYIKLLLIFYLIKNLKILIIFKLIS